MSKTWTQIRRELARDLREPVFRRIGDSVTVLGSTGIANFYSAALGKISNTFGLPYAFAYVSYTTDGNAPAGEELEITSFASDGSNGWAYVQPSPTAGLAAGDKVEIHELWSVQEKLNAVNKGIDDCWPAFYQEVVNETIVIEKFKREYDLTQLAVPPRHLVGAYLEPVFRVGIGKPTSAAAGTLVDTGIDYSTTLETGKSYEIVIYYGKGAGQARTISSYTAGTRTFNVTPNWTVTPDTTSEYMVKNMSDVYYNWLGPLTRIRLDQDENPQTLEVLYDTYEIWGARIRLVYTANLQHIVNESSTLDDVSAGFVLLRAKYHLYKERIASGPQFELKTTATLADISDKDSDKYRERNRMKRMNGTIKTDMGQMNWSDREMPFRR